MMDNASKTPLLDQIRVPSDMRNFSDNQLTELAIELRRETINAVSLTGGQTASSAHKAKQYLQQDATIQQIPNPEWR